MRQLHGVHRCLQQRDAACQTAHRVNSADVAPSCVRRPRPVVVGACGCLWRGTIGLVTTVVVLLAVRRPLDVLVLRQPGTLHAAVGAGEIANFYNLQAFNRTATATPFAVDVVEPAGGRATALGLPGEVPPYALLGRKASGDDSDDVAARVEHAAASGRAHGRWRHPDD